MPCGLILVGTRVFILTHFKPLKKPQVFGNLESDLIDLDIGRTGVFILTNIKNSRFLKAWI